MRQIRSTLWCATAGLLLAGCQDPRFEAAQQRRNASIEKVVNSYEREEAKRSQRVNKTLAQIEKVENERPEKLKGMIDKLEQDRIQREQHWRDIQPAWNDRLRKLFQGDPKGADDAFARMFY